VSLPQFPEWNLNDKLGKNFCWVLLIRLYQGIVTKSRQIVENLGLNLESSFFEI